MGFTALRRSGSGEAKGGGGDHSRPPPLHRRLLPLPHLDGEEGMMHGSSLLGRPKSLREGPKMDDLVATSTQIGEHSASGFATMATVGADWFERCKTTCLKTPATKKTEKAFVDIFGGEDDPKIMVRRYFVVLQVLRASLPGMKLRTTLTSDAIVTAPCELQ